MSKQKQSCKKKNDSLHEGQYAVAFFSATWCYYCKKYEPMYEQFAKDAEGQYLFLKTYSEEASAKYDIQAYPTIIIFNSSGEKQIVEDRTKLAEEIAFFDVDLNNTLDIINKSAVKSPLAILKSAKLLKTYQGADVEMQRNTVWKYVESLFDNDDAMVRYSALESYADLLGDMTKQWAKNEAFAASPFSNIAAKSQNISGYNNFNMKIPKHSDLTSKQIRKMFNDISPYVRYKAIETYDLLKTMSIISAEEKLEAAKELQPRFDDEDDEDQDIYLKAIDVYIPIISEHIKSYPLSGADAEIVKGIRSLFKSTSQKAQLFSLKTYGDISATLSADEITKYSNDIIKLFNHKDFEVQKLAINTYAKISIKLPQKDQIKTATILMAKLKDKDIEIQIAAISAYGKLAYQLNVEHVSKAAKELQTLFNHSDTGIKKAALAAYAKLDPLLNSDIALSGLQALLAISQNEDNEIKTAALETYGKLAYKLPYADQIQGIKILEGIIKDNSGSVKVSAISAYSKLLSENMQQEIIADSAEFLRELFEDDSSIVKIIAIAVYSSLADKLSNKEIAKGAKALRLAFEDTDANETIEGITDIAADVRNLAISVYCELSSRFSNNEIINGLKALEKLFYYPNKLVFYDESKLRKNAINAYVKLLTNEQDSLYELSSLEILNCLNALKILFTDSDYDIKCAVINAYSILSIHLKGDERDKEMKELKSLMGENNSYVQSTAIIAYEILTNGKVLFGEEATGTAKTFINLFQNVALNIEQKNKGIQQAKINKSKKENCSPTAKGCVDQTNK